MPLLFIDDFAGGDSGCGSAAVKSKSTGSLVLLSLNGPFAFSAYSSTGFANAAPVGDENNPAGANDAPVSKSNKLLLLMLLLVSEVDEDDEGFIPNIFETGIFLLCK